MKSQNPTQPLRLRTALLSLFGPILVAAISVASCNDSEDPEPENGDECGTCVQYDGFSVDCQLNTNKGTKHLLGCVMGSAADNPSQTQMDSACQTLCAHYSVCSVVDADPFSCDGDSYDTDGLPGFEDGEEAGGDDGGDGLDETGSEPVWEPSEYAYYDSTNDVYIINENFVDEVRANPSLLLLDGVTLYEIGTGGFEFRGVSSGSLMYLLGLRTGDIPLTVNGHYVSDMGEVLAALSAVQNSTALSVRVSRGGTTVFLDYLIR